MNKIQLTGGGVLVLAGVTAVIGVGWYLKNRIPAALNAVNPTNSENIFNKSYEELVGGAENAGLYSDRAFALVDKINPFNESDYYADQVLGLDKFTWVPVGGVKVPVSNESINNVKAAVTPSQSTADKIFGAIDLINPFNDDDTYAEKVWGISK